MQFEFLFADSKPDPNVRNVSLITREHISKLQILSPELNIQVLYNTYQKCTTSCHIPVSETIYRKVLSITLTFTSMLHEMKM